MNKVYTVVTLEVFFNRHVFAFFELNDLKEVCIFLSTR